MPGPRLHPAPQHRRLPARPEHPLRGASPGTPGAGQQRSPVPPSSPEATLGGRGSGGGRCSPGRGCPASRGRHLKAHLPGRAVNNAQRRYGGRRAPATPGAAPARPSPAQPLAPSRRRPRPRCPRPARRGPGRSYHGSAAAPRSLAAAAGQDFYRAAAGLGLRGCHLTAALPGPRSARRAAVTRLRRLGPRAEAAGARPSLKGAAAPGSVSRVPRAVTGLPRPGPAPPWGCDSVWGQVPVGLGTSEGLCGDKTGALWGWGCARVNEGTWQDPYGDTRGSVWGCGRVPVGTWPGP